MSLVIRQTMHLLLGRQADSDAYRKARIRLDDGTVIIVSQLDGPPPNPSLLIDEFSSLEGFSKEAMTKFEANPDTHKNFARIWKLYKEQVAENNEHVIDDTLHTRMLHALEHEKLVLRLEGRKHDQLAIGEKVSAHLVFYGFGRVQLGTITDIELL